ncbi:MAG: hypothetical protein AAFZ11_11250 [Pseudomonadota bacterium]
MFKKTAFIFAPALLLAACGGEATEADSAAPSGSSDPAANASGSVDVAGNWNCTELLQDANFNVVTTVMMEFDGGSGEQTLNLLRTDRAGNKLKVKTNSQFNYAQEDSTVTITMTANELEEAEVNGQRQRGGQLLSLKRKAERLPSEPTTFRMNPTPSGMVEFWNVGANQKMECSRA